MGDNDNHDTKNSGNNISYNNFFGNNKSLMNGDSSNNSFFPQQYERMDIQNRVGKDITNVLSNQNLNNIQLKKNMSHNQDTKEQMNIQKGMPFYRNHSRTTSSIQLENKDKQDVKIYQDQIQQQHQQQNLIQYNEQMISGTSSNPFFSNNINANRSGNFSQNSNMYNQLNRNSVQNYCEKENNFANQFQQTSQQSIQNQYTNPMVNNNPITNNQIKTNNLFVSQAVPSTFIQSNDANVAPLQPMQNEEDSDEVISGHGSNTTIGSVVPTHQAHIEYTREIISHLRQSELNIMYVFNRQNKE